MSQVVEQARRG